MRNAGGLFGKPRFRIGFTSTRNGLTDYQALEIQRILREYREQHHKNIEFHHGDCVGGDAQAHEIAVSYGYLVIIHPPLEGTLRAYCTGGRVLEPRPFLVRNREIVKSSNIVLAAPDTKHEKLRSGTWSTIRFARATHHDLLIINPDPEP